MTSGDATVNTLESVTPKGFADRLRTARGAYELPQGLPATTEEIARDLLAYLFPHHARPGVRPATIEVEERDIRRRLARALVGPDLPAEGAAAVTLQFMMRIPGVYDALLADADAICEGDPAARSRDEVILAYPGFFAIALHRIANQLHRLGGKLVARLVAEYAHRETGIDIHPAAQIGARFSIDHGTGVVIGATAVLGDGVKLYQGVTLGAASVRKDLSRTKRHPTIGHRVVIYSNATILGGDTEVGDDSIIGGNVWLTTSVPPRSVVTGGEHQQRRRTAPAAEDMVEFHI